MKDEMRKDSEKVEARGDGKLPTSSNPQDKTDERIDEARTEINRYLRYMGYRCKLEGY
jgi:hypothetical protein